MFVIAAPSPVIVEKVTLLVVSNAWLAESCKLPVPSMYWLAVPAPVIAIVPTDVTSELVTVKAEGAVMPIEVTVPTPGSKPVSIKSITSPTVVDLVVLLLDFDISIESPVVGTV
jgi:hypothetical protein